LVHHTSTKETNEPFLSNEPENAQFSQAEQGKADLENTVIRLQSEKSELEKQVVELRSRADQIERRSNEQKLAEAKKHAEDIQFLKNTNQQLKVMYQHFLT
jgi:dynein light intermediate chain